MFDFDDISAIALAEACIRADAIIDQQAREYSQWLGHNEDWSNG